MYTHLARKTCVNYQHSGRLYGHAPAEAGKIHASNREYVRHLGTVYRTLCGEVVYDNAGRDAFGEAIAPNVCQTADADGAGVTCQRCARKVRQRRAAE